MPGRNLVQWLRAFCVAAALLAAALLPGVSMAQAFPSEPVRIVVPYAAGGATDIVARLVARELSSVWKQNVIVDNRTGANGIIGAEYVARSAPNGLTLLLVVPGHLINPVVTAKVPFDVIADFTPVSQIAASPWLVVVNSDLGVSTLGELVALARRQPGKLAFGSSEPSSRLAGELFKQKAGVEMMNVPYKGASQVMPDLISNQIQVAFTTSLSVMAFANQPKIRILAVASNARSQAFPAVPTAAEAGLPGYEVGAWYGLYAPAKTPQPVVQAIHEALVEVLKRPAMRERLAGLGAIPLGSSPQEFTDFTNSEYQRYRKVVSEARIQPE